MASVTNSDPSRVLTKPHRRLMHLLAELGLEIRSEVSVGRFRLDVFCEEVWLGFEADGRRAHAFRRKKDKARDEWLDREAGIPVLRLDEQVLRKVCWDDTKDAVRAFIDAHAGTIKERRERGRWVLV